MRSTHFIGFAWKVDRLDTFGVIIIKFLIAISFSIDAVIFTELIDSIVISYKSGSSFSVIPFMLIMIIWVLQVVLQMSYKKLTKRLCMKLSMALSLRVIRKKINIKYSVLECKPNWDLFERIGNDPSEQWSVFLLNLLEIFMYIIQIGSIVALIASKNYALAGLVGGLLIPYYFISLKNGKEEYSAYEESTTHFRRASYYRRVLSDREYAAERGLFGFSEWINCLWNKEYSKAIEIEKKANKKVFMRNTAANIASVLFVGAVAVAMLPTLKSAIITAGFYVAVLKAIIQFVDSVSLNFSHIAIEYEKGKLFLQDLLAFESLEESNNGDGISIEITEIETIQFDNVSFTYPNETKAVLNNLSFVLYGNKQYAFVGENGAGKSTIIKLLTGFYDNYEGSIRINGIELRDIPQGKLRSLFSIVYQDYAKYEFSLRMNLFPNSDYDSSRLNEVLDETGLIDLIAKYPDGIETRLGKLDNNAVDLSSGQWQMLAIARSLLSDAPIHILDEPTSAIDPKQEVKVYSIFKKNMRNKFALLITHRLGAARLADEIIVLSNGKVIEQGKHDHLLKNGKAYKEMFETQRSWYVEEA